MTKIDVYDIDAQQIEKIADENDESIAEAFSRIIDSYFAQLDLWNT